MAIGLLVQGDSVLLIPMTCTFITIIFNPRGCPPIWNIHNIPSRILLLWLVHPLQHLPRRKGKRLDIPRNVMNTIVISSIHLLFLHAQHLKCSQHTLSTHPHTSFPPIFSTSPDKNNIVIAHNTFIECEYINLGWVVTSDKNIWFANNLFKKTDGSVFAGIGSSVHFSGNMYSGNLGASLDNSISEAEFYAVDGDSVVSYSDMYGYYAPDRYIPLNSTLFHDCLHLPLLCQHTMNLT